VALLSSCANFARAGSSLVLNGSFETNSTPSTVYNLPNLSVGGYIAHVTGFGTAEEIDLIKDGDLGISPQDGIGSWASTQQLNRDSMMRFPWRYRRHWCPGLVTI
jgi:hypothetical protein